ncbi:MAG TPA: diguanylate cyclase [Actinomycetota bacterium]|nr:diguanylate cyclase [Actinomycetota bacterium]
MSLRGRLTMFFAGIVIVPLVGAALLLQGLASREVEERNEAALHRGSTSAVALWRERLSSAGREVRHVAQDISQTLGGVSSEQALSRLVAEARDDGALDFLVVIGADDRILASEVEQPRFAPGIPEPAPKELAAEVTPPGVIRARVNVLAGERTATVAGGFYADRGFAREIARAVALDVAVTGGGRVLAASGPTVPGAATAAAGPFHVDGDLRAYATQVEGSGEGLVLFSPLTRAGLGAAIWLVILGILLAASALGYLLARLIARPLQRLSEGAMAVAAGDLDARLDTEGHGDVAQLADAFNSMTENLREYVGALERSRDELRRGLDRLGATLRSTHDLEGMLGVILDTAAVTLSARSGAVFLHSGAGRGLRLEVAHGYEAPAGSSLRIGEGIAGRAGAGVPMLVPSGIEASASAPIEPQTQTAIAVPLIRGDRTMGVLALYGRTVPEPYEEDDVETLGAFAAQASVAIENVLLHQEAQRLSITDGLTGVWNRRYLQLTLTKEIERAQRFERPLSVLMLDIDRFKDVNDAYGHQVGDEVLVEVSRRTMSMIRGQIDALARYGGEEFVVVLPETPADGARVVADKILDVIRRESFVEEPGPGIPLTVSIGVASYPGDGDSADELLRAADLAMYRAKQAGRDRVETAG